MNGLGSDQGSSKLHGVQGNTFEERCLAETFFISA